MLRKKQHPTKSQLLDSIHKVPKQEAVNSGFLRGKKTLESKSEAKTSQLESRLTQDLHDGHENSDDDLIAEEMHDNDPRPLGDLRPPSQSSQVTSHGGTSVDVEAESDRAFTVTPMHNFNNDDVVSALLHMGIEEGIALQISETLTTKHLRSAKVTDAMLKEIGVSNLDRLKILDAINRHQGTSNAVDSWKGPKGAVDAIARLKQKAGVAHHSSSSRDNCQKLDTPESRLVFSERLTDLLEDTMDVIRLYRKDSGQLSAEKALEETESRILLALQEAKEQQWRNSLRVRGDWPTLEKSLVGLHINDLSAGQEDGKNDVSSP